MLADKIRKKALARATSPEHLDAMLTVAPPLGWLALVVLLAGVGGLLCWSVVSFAPVKVSARGILLTDGEILTVLSPADGILKEMSVDLGKHVSQGEILARLSNPKVEAAIEDARIEVSRSEQNLQASIAANSEVIKALKQEFANQESEFNAQMADGAALVQRRQEALDEQLHLHDQKLATNADLWDARNALDNARIALNAAKSDYSSKRARYLSDINAADAAIRQDKTALGNAQQKLEDLVRQFDRVSIVRAQQAGIVIEAVGKRGDYVADNQRLIELLPTSATKQNDLPLLAVLYVNSEGAARLRPGDDVEVVPSSVQLERDGFIRGKIVSVAATPTTRARMLSRLANEVLVNTLTGNGPVSEVIVGLSRKSSTVSGLAWSTRSGPNFEIKPGTTADASFIIDRKRVASFIFPRIDDVLPTVSSEAQDGQVKAPARSDKG